MLRVGEIGLQFQITTLNGTRAPVRPSALAGHVIRAYFHTELEGTDSYCRYSWLERFLARPYVFILSPYSGCRP